VALRNAPSKCDLRPSFVVFLANFYEDWVILQEKISAAAFLQTFLDLTDHQFPHVFSTIVNLILIPEGAVLLDMDTLALLPLCELCLLEPWVILNSHRISILRGCFLWWELRSWELF